MSQLPRARVAIALIACVLAGCTTASKAPAHSGTPATPTATTTSAAPTTAVTSPHPVPAPVVPACDILAGKPLPADAEETGCAIGNTIRAAVTFRCPGGFEVIAFLGTKAQTSYWAKRGGIVHKAAGIGNDAAAMCARS